MNPKCFLTVMLMTILSGCQEDYTCTCFQQSVQVSVYTTHDTYENASKSCEAHEKQYGADPFNEYSCQLK